MEVRLSNCFIIVYFFKLKQLEIVRAKIVNLFDSLADYCVEYWNL